jgi:hypothetical protein
MVGEQTFQHWYVLVMNVLVLLEAQELTVMTIPSQGAKYIKIFWVLLIQMMMIMVLVQ